MKLKRYDGKERKWCVIYLHKLDNATIEALNRYDTYWDVTQPINMFYHSNQLKRCLNFINNMALEQPLHHGVAVPHVIKLDHVKKEVSLVFTFKELNRHYKLKQL
jgi:hypothetical protein